MDFPIARNINGPISELGHQMRLRAESILAAPTGSRGRRRGLHVIAMIERSGSSNVQRKSGTFSDELCRVLSQELETSNATLQPEEARFKEINTWHDPHQIRRELRSNLMRLLHVPQDPCVMHALDLHVLQHLYMRFRGFSEDCHLATEDFYQNPTQRAALARCIQHVPELVLWSTLTTTTREFAEPQAA